MFDPLQLPNSSLPGSFVHGIFQARILKPVALSSSRGSSRPGIEPMSLPSPALADRLFTTSATWEGQGGHEDPVKTLVPNAGERFYLMH